MRQDGQRRHSGVLSKGEPSRPDDDRSAGNIQSKRLASERSIGCDVDESAPSKQIPDAVKALGARTRRAGRQRDRFRRPRAHLPSGHPHGTFRAALRIAPDTRARAVSARCVAGRGGSPAASRLRVRRDAPSPWRSCPGGVPRRVGCRAASRQRRSGRGWPGAPAPVAISPIPLRRGRPPMRAPVECGPCERSRRRRPVRRESLSRCWAAGSAAAASAG